MTGTFTTELTEWGFYRLQNAHVMDWLEQADWTVIDSYIREKGANHEHDANLLDSAESL